MMILYETEFSLIILSSEFAMAKMAQIYFV